MLRYALMLDDLAMIRINIFGTVTNMAYVAVYYYYSPNTVHPKTGLDIQIYIFVLN